MPTANAMRRITVDRSDQRESPARAVQCDGAPSVVAHVLACLLSFLWVTQSPE